MRKLADYFESVCVDQGITEACQSFNSGITKNPPVVRPNGVNRILLYPGSFNPPHKGHSDLLTHVFNNAGHDLHLVAAIILLTDDEMLVHKTSEEKNPLILKREERVMLWRGSGKLQDWAWVYPGSQASWPAFRQQLSTKMQNDEKPLKFILLGGPDWMNSQTLHDPQYWGCADAITSDVSRPVDFRYPTTLRQLPGCTPWTGVTFDKYKLERQVVAKMRGKLKTQKDVQDAVAAAIATIERLATCQTYRKPKGNIRFVPCNVALRPPNPPSSTRIRQIIATSPLEEMKQEFEKVALCSGLLFQFVEERINDKWTAAEQAETDGDQ